MLQEHEEGRRLVRAADEILTAADQAELEAAFARVEAEEMGEGTHERYHQLAHEWAG
jgi:hemerythrin-like domain-containing protein